MEYISNSPAETEALGEALAARLTAGTVVAFTGDLGKDRFHTGTGPGIGRSRPGHQPHLYHCQRI